MTQPSTLLEVRSVARARAVEDFHYFACHVLGLYLDEKLCTEIQRDVEKERDLTELSLKPHVLKALSAWLSILGRVEPLPKAPTETFQWLFGERIAA